ncbi:MAG: hypothetical protein H6738_19140 [Alphaproteobacteria bacterium]|nr:hypothetical protein [Alphaproteobacteria bacterium]MCB9698905.1 hypothetical protein [Alphaproteobacteria bacterium]
MILPNGDRWVRRAGALVLGMFLGASSSDCVPCQTRFDAVPTGAFELSDSFLEERGWERGTIIVTDDEVRVEVRTLAGGTATLTGRRPPREDAVHDGSAP